MKGMKGMQGSFLGGLVGAALCSVHSASTLRHGTLTLTLKPPNCSWACDNLGAKIHTRMAVQ